MEIRSCWVQLFLLLMYMMLIFVFSRLLDFVFWYHHGVSSMELVDPIVLSVRHLKQILDNRGISYTGCVEKNELAQLVKESADIVEEEVKELKVSNGQTSRALPSSYFKGAADFYEQVEDSKDSVWLVHVIPSNRHYHQLLNEGSWRSICNYVTPFAIRTGVFDCALDMSLCESKSWKEPLLLLALPKGTKAKDKMVAKTFYSHKQQVIIQWIREELSVRVHKLASLKELEEEWLSSSVYSSQDIKVLLLTHLLNPPLFLAALSIKFTGRVKFGIFSVKKEDTEVLPKKIKNFNHAPSYLIITQNNTVIYGQKKSHRCNFDSMNAFIKVLQPEINDIFVFSLIVVNMLAVLKIFQMSKEVNSWWWEIGRVIWTLVSYNFRALAVWLIIVSIIQWRLIHIFTEASTTLLRFFALTNIGALTISDYQALYDAPLLFFSSFLVYSFLTTRMLKKYCEPQRSRQEDVAPQNGWIERLQLDSLFLDSLFRRPMFVRRYSQTGNDDQMELDERMDTIVARLTLPNFWLQPAIPNEYVKDLPTWTFRSNREEEMDAIKNLMDGISEKCDASETDEVKVTSNKSTSGSSCPYQYDCKLIRNGKMNYCSKCLKSKQKDGMETAIYSPECAICLETYESGMILCGLPCRHSFHKDCIFTWLERDNHHCPICRWPAYKYQQISRTTHL